MRETKLHMPHVLSILNMFFLVSSPFTKTNMAHTQTACLIVSKINDVFRLDSNHPMDVSQQTHTVTKLAFI